MYSELRRTRYREAGKIVNLALHGLILQVKPGVKVLDLCKFGDTVITQKCGTIYQKKVKGRAIEKGVAFPTCNQRAEMPYYHQEQ